MRTRTLVVAGLIASPEGRLLITQRRADQNLPLKWEFPGGKVEPGESPEHALVRELSEEIGVSTRVGRIWDVLFHAYESFDLVMLVYHCRLEPGQEVRCVQVNDFAWCRPDELGAYDVLTADRPLVDRLTREGLPAW
jgi:8-oxo-dGTP diphosphatase